MFHYPFSTGVGVIDVKNTWPAGVQAVFTDRLGGCSLPPFESFNLGNHVHDNPAHVMSNRASLSRRIGARPVFLQQIHGVDVLNLTADTPDGAVADACWTDSPGLACTVMVADCLAILLSSERGDSVAAIHAGWRGLAGRQGVGIVEALLSSWPAAATPDMRKGIHAWLGPCIGPTAFEVGAEVFQAFTAFSSDAGAAFCPIATNEAGEPKFLADLAMLARLHLLAAGIERIHGNDSSAAWCTVSHSDSFFSHRRDAQVLGSTGRMAACIWMGGA